ncbi:PpiC-type peptidyl-prolyl cis-trans isomerase [Desulfurispirillum indicum S5]|uniref:peptidylprolyl isomerase n=1 Tax=Desulfurispirillum indicum (strain ATCC BAA-1389 / DSM 22839 / S5) TaxID=653733 RepID=E6W059_DESIS|nr:peptidyl-prolyl cis-trans isomerase [Desulfurispirillum indicum]ADU65185.1 PpiC-type peptidyl-prolyl cis-trans isomerase [Desulfurispirillum indicum S5]
MKKMTLRLCLAAGLTLGTLAGVALASDTVLATVEKRQITQQDLNRAIQSLPDELRAQVRSNPEFKAQLLDELVRQEMVYHEAQRQNFQENEVVRNRLKLLERELMINAFLEEYLSRNVSVSEQDLKEFYERNKARFVTQATVAASHILLEDEQKAREVLRRARAGENFGQLAREHSLDPGSARQEGFIGEFYRGQGLVKEFEDAAFAAEVGVHPELVRTEFGYHIIKVHEKNPSRTVSLDEARDRVTEIIAEEKQNQALMRLIQELELRYSVRTHKDRIQ